MILLLRREFRTPCRMNEVEINVSPEEGKGVFVLHSLSVERGMESLLNTFVETHPTVKGIALVTEGATVHLGDTRLNFTISLDHPEKKPLKLRVSPESFCQVNPEQNGRLVQTVVEFSEAGKDETVLDLYSGIGNLTLPLALRAKETLGIEENRKAVEDARFNAEQNGIRCQFIPGRVEILSRNWGEERLHPPHLVVLDPPRTGCRTILDQVVKLKPKKLVYVSCEPTTFSRDLCLFAERGYRLEKLVLIDMFPQSYHMEVVGLLKE
jgi:23S rRNA (uracil-5-)-methyltransferase RumA